MPHAVALLVVVLTVSLGRWQIGRADEKKALQARIEAAQRDIPLDNEALRNALDRGDPLAQLSERRVRVQGRFLPDKTVFADNRQMGGIAGFHVIAPFEITGIERPVLIVRGWVPRDPADRNALPTFITPPRQVIEGQIQLRSDRALELGRFMPGPSDRLWPNVTVERFEAWSGQKLQPWVIREGRTLAPGEPAQPLGADASALGRLVQLWPAPSVGIDKHYGYAFQWFSLAGLTCALWGFFSWRARRAGTIPV
jgi:cytochrome oxidase assembly protein ShyY1